MWYQQDRSFSLPDSQGCTFLSLLAESIRIPVDSSWSGQGEFRSKKRGDSLSKRIVGFPEHITRNSAQVLVSRALFWLWTCLKMPLPWSPCLPPYYVHVEIISLKSWLNSWTVKFLDSRWYWLHWRFCCFSRSGLWHHFATNICLLSDLVVWQFGVFDGRWNMRRSILKFAVAQMACNGGPVWVIRTTNCLSFFEILWAAFEAVLGARMHYGHPDIMNKLLGEKDTAGPVKICENTFKHIWDPCDTMNIPHVFGSTKRLNISQLHLNE